MSPYAITPVTDTVKVVGTICRANPRADLFVNGISESGGCPVLPISRQYTLEDVRNFVKRQPGRSKISGLSDFGGDLSWTQQTQRVTFPPNPHHLPPLDANRPTVPRLVRCSPGARPSPSRDGRNAAFIVDCGRGVVSGGARRYGRIGRQGSKDPRGGFCQGDSELGRVCRRVFQTTRTQLPVAGEEHPDYLVREELGDAEWYCNIRHCHETAYAIPEKWCDARTFFFIERP